jgi:hypothetical protein
MRQFIVSEDDYVIDERFSDRTVQEKPGLEACGEVRSWLGVSTELYGGEQGFSALHKADKEIVADAARLAREIRPKDLPRNRNATPTPNDLTVASVVAAELGFGQSRGTRTGPGRPVRRPACRKAAVRVVSQIYPESRRQAHEGAPGRQPRQANHRLVR